MATVLVSMASATANEGEVILTKMALGINYSGAIYALRKN